MPGSHQRSIVHIGFHKTGSTSIQKFLWRFRTRFAELGMAVYEGQHIRDNHVELHVAAMAPERMTPFKHANGISGGDAYRSNVEQRLRAFAAASPQPSYLFSAEGVSYLRDRDELEWLKSALPGEVTIVAYLRNRNDYLSAYRFMLQNNMVPESDDKASVAYVAPDSWLWDYSARLQNFRDVFGTCNVTVLDYDAEMQADGNIIPSFVRLLRTEDSFQAEDWKDLLFNQRPHA